MALYVVICKLDLEESPTPVQPPCPMVCPDQGMNRAMRTFNGQGVVLGGINVRELHPEDTARGTKEGCRELTAQVGADLGRWAI